MSINNFIPNVWSQTLLKELDREYIAVKNSNREFEGDIKKSGDRVHIHAIGPIDVFNYTKNTDMTQPQILDGTRRTINIDQVRGFNFLLDDVDKAQAVPTIMQSAMRQAANSLANAADSYIFGLHSQVTAANTITSALNAANVVDVMLSARERLLANDVNSNNDTVLEVSPAVGALILRAKILTSTENSGAIDNGYIGDFLGFKVFVSNNIVRTGAVHHCFARTTRAIAFAEQVHEIEAYRPERRFADAVKGLHLYGAGIVYPNEVIRLSLTPAGAAT